MRKSYFSTRSGALQFPGAGREITRFATWQERVAGRGMHLPQYTLTPLRPSYGSFKIRIL
jgi:hypothetical protein